MTDQEQKPRRWSLFPRGRRAWRRVAIVWGSLTVVTAATTAFVTCMPGSSHVGPLKSLTDDQRDLAARLQSHVQRLAADIGERDFSTYPALNEAADYIRASFAAAPGAAVTDHTFLIGKRPLINVVAELPGTTDAIGGERAVEPGEIVVVGAHYDAVFDCPGANDNASGVAAVIELARLLAGRKLPRTLRLVAFVNEEPPYFRTEHMGSWVYARDAAARGDKVVAMVAVETIGYYSDKPGSQAYPFPFSLLYPDTGNFIAFVGNLSSRGLVRRSIGTFREHAKFPSEGVAAPGWITGLGWSDHWSFWQFGYPAIMVTDTAPFRYDHYHKPTDTPDRLDYERMARVVEGLAEVVAALAGG